MNTVTPLQAAMLKRIARSEFTAVNGGEPSTMDDVGWVWASEIIITAEDKGVFTSMLNAKLVEHGDKRRSTTIRLTKNGFEAYKAGRKP